METDEEKRIRRRQGRIYDVFSIMPLYNWGMYMTDEELTELRDRITKFLEDEKGMSEVEKLKLDLYNLIKVAERYQELTGPLFRKNDLAIQELRNADYELYTLLQHLSNRGDA